MARPVRCPAPGLLAAALLVFCPQTAAAREFSTSPSPPQTGLELPGEPLKGRKPPPMGGFSDAYGNPVTPDVPEKKAKKRLPPGAYGGDREPERPLPNYEDQRPVW